MREDLPGHTLIERIKHEGTEPRETRFGTLRLDLRNPVKHGSHSAYRAYIEGHKTFIEFTRKEAEILWLLMCVKGGVISTAEIQGWFTRDLPDHKEVPTANSENVIILTINKKLKSVTNRVCIELEGVPHGTRGYYLRAD